MSAASDFELAWATPADDPDIRALVGSVAMPGAIAVRFAREPDYFLGTTIMGDTCDVLVARHRADGRLVGIACRAESRAYVNGQESSLGYIGQIRVAPGFRGYWLVQKGAAWFEEASPPGLIYIGVIAEANPRARDLLVGVRPPRGIRTALVSGLTSCGIVLRQREPEDVRGLDVGPATRETLADVVAFMQRYGPRRQFFPAYTLDDFVGGTRLRGLEPGHVMVARRGAAIVGVMAAWDQSSYKQDIVDGYGPMLARWRPVYDLGLRLVRARPLTPPGQAIPLAFAACVCVADDDRDVMRALLSACERSALSRGKSFLMVGLADGDPLLPVVRKRMHVAYRSDLYALSWSGHPSETLDTRAPYVEIATL